MKKVLAITVILLSVTLFGFSQRYFSDNVDSRFPGGEIGLKALILMNIEYPQESVFALSVGCSFSSIEITPKGEIGEIKIINSVDPHIDAEILRVLKLSRGKWLSDNSETANLRFYLTVYFVPIDYVVTSNLILEWDKPKIQFLSADSMNPIKNRSFISPVVVTSLAFTNLNIPIELYSTIESRFNAHMRLKEYDAALPLLDELIKRNPFSQDLYLSRISLYNILGKKDMAMADINKVNNFADGKSLYSISFKFYNSEGKEIMEEEVPAEEIVGFPDQDHKSILRINFRGDTLEMVTYKADNPNIRDGLTKLYFNGKPKQAISYFEGKAREEDLPGFVDKMPSFKGGDVDNFRIWVSKKVVYPQLAAQETIVGRVLVLFKVQPDGSVSDVYPLTYIHPSLMKAALKAVASSPRWTPGYLNGKPVSVSFSITVSFALQ